MIKEEGITEWVVPRRGTSTSAFAWFAAGSFLARDWMGQEEACWKGRAAYVARYWALRALEVSIYRARELAKQANTAERLAVEGRLARQEGGKRGRCRPLI